MLWRRRRRGGWKPPLLTLLPLQLPLPLEGMKALETGEGEEGGTEEGNFFSIAQLVCSIIFLLCICRDTQEDRASWQGPPRGGYPPGRGGRGHQEEGVGEASLQEDGVGEAPLQEEEGDASSFTLPRINLYCIALSDFQL